MTESAAFVNYDSLTFDGLPTNDPSVGITTAQLEAILKSGNNRNLYPLAIAGLPVFRKGVPQQTGTYSLSLDAGASAWNATQNTGLVRYLYGFTDGNRTGDVALRADVQISASTSRECSVSASVFLSLGSPYAVGPQYIGNYLPVSSSNVTQVVNNAFVGQTKTVATARVPCELFRRLARSSFALETLLMYEFGGLYETWGGVWEGDIRQFPTYSQRYHLGEVIPLTLSENTFTASKSGNFSTGVLQVVSDSQADGTPSIPRERLYALTIGEGVRGVGINYNTPNGNRIGAVEGAYRLTGLANRSGKTLVTKTAYTANITLTLTNA